MANEFGVNSEFFRLAGIRSLAVSDYFTGFRVVCRKRPGRQLEGETLTGSAGLLSDR